MLKAMTGKGPKNVSVFMNGDSIEMVASEILTTFEKNLLDNNRNIAIIKHVRELFFSVKEKELCQMILKVAGCGVTLSKVIISVEKDEEQIDIYCRSERMKPGQSERVPREAHRETVVN